MKRSVVKILLVLLMAGCCCWPNLNLAASANQAMVRLYDSQSWQLQTEFLPFGIDYQADFSLASGDLGGDGVGEIIVAAGVGHKPEVKIFRQDGSLVGSFLPYVEGFTGGVRVITCDLDKDGRDEIITAPGRTGGPHLRIFDGYGQPKFNLGFMAFDKNYDKGITLACADVNRDGKNEIIVARAYDVAKVEVRAFDKDGRDLKTGWQAENYSRSFDLNIAAGDFGNDGQAEVVINGGYGFANVELRQIDGSVIKSFYPYGSEFPGGVNLAVADINNDGRKEIITGAGFLGGPHLKVFDSYGSLKSEFFPFDSSLDQGIRFALVKSLAGASGRIAVAPDRLKTDNGVGRYIKVDVGLPQTLYLYEDGFLIKQFLISSGTGYLHTPLGEFTVYRKRPDVRMTGPGYDLPHVPWVLSFQGPYTLHGTYWHHNFGHPMSHGCVNMYTPDARWVYDWADIGTVVKIYK